MEKLSFDKYWELTEAYVDFQGILSLLYANYGNEYIPLKVALKNYVWSDALEKQERLDIIKAAIEEIYTEDCINDISEEKNEEFHRIYNSIKLNALPYELAYL